MCIYNRIEYIHKINTLEKMEDASNKSNFYVYLRGVELRLRLLHTRTLHIVSIFYSFFNIFKGR